MAVIVVALLAGLGACYRPNPNVTETGKGKPQMTIEFPAESTSGSRETAAISVTNPGPGDMPSVVVAFSRIGDPSLPEPIVDSAIGGTNPAIVSIDPDPDVIAPDAVTYRFAGLPEGESMTISFTFQLPKGRGEVGNAVQVYDGAEPERATGGRLSTTLTG